MLFQYLSQCTTEFFLLLFAKKMVPLQANSDRPLDKKSPDTWKWVFLDISTL